MESLDKSDMDKSLWELKRRREIVIWQLSIAIDRDIIQKKEERLKQLEEQIKNLSPK